LGIGKDHKTTHEPLDVGEDLCQRRRCDRGARLVGCEYEVTEAVPCRKMVRCILALRGFHELDARRDRLEGGDYLPRMLASGFVTIGDDDYLGTAQRLGVLRSARLRPCERPSVT
jgi:hypothetical protein